jgi:hypothetical protein
VYVPLLLWVLPVLGQHTSRNLTGMVTDPHREPLRGAVVQIENERTHEVVSYIVGRSGLYSFKRIDGDADYHVWATFKKRRSAMKELSGFDSHSSKTINLIIRNE